MGKDTGGPAFPEAYYANVYAKEPTFREGMTLRDWFAGQAMAATMLHTFEAARVEGETAPEAARILAIAAYKTADAMIAERNKP